MVSEQDIFKKIALMSVISVLIILAFFILRPILVSIIFGLILSFILYPCYKKILIYVKSENLSALLICAAIIILIILPLIWFIPLLAKQIFSIYLFLEKTDFITPIKTLFPSIANSPDILQSISVAIESFTSKATSAILSEFTDFLLNSFTALLHVLLILFVLFFGLRDGEKLIAYLQSISPLSKETEKKAFARFKDITQSVIFGQVIIGIAQGIVTGIGLFVFGVPNALVLTIIATFAGILPIIGPWLVWVPVDIYFFLTNQTFSAVGLLIYGLIVITWIDNLLRPLIVSKRTKINSVLILIGMTGGLFVFGILGLIIGPLIISYVLLLLESYKNLHHSMQT